MFKNKVLTAAIILVSIFTNAQIQEREFGTVEIPFNQLSSNPITVFDTQSGITNQIDNGVYSYLSLYINNNESPFTWYELKATLNIIPLKSNGEQDTGNTTVKEVTVNYNPNYISSSGTDFNDLSFLKFENRYGLVIKLVSFTALNLANGSVVSPDNAYIKAGFRAKRFYELSEQYLVPIATPFSYSNNGNSGQAELEIQWNSIKGALEYELEWTWVDGYHPQTLSALLSPGQISLSNRDFELNNTRIITKDLKYRIPLIYSKGYIIYRVRGISRFKNSSNRNFYGIWSSGEQIKEFVSNWPHYFTVNSDHENGKNWQFQASYAEEGKKKEVVSYFDGSLRNRQTVTKINTDNNAVVGEVIYDVHGRPAIEILPIPVKEEYIHFYNNVNVNEYGVPYSHKDFDWESSNQSSEISCDIKADKMSNVSGSSKYYSSNNNFLNRKNHNFIPNANGFPYSQIEYSNDNTGRVVRKSGVGQKHQLGTGQEMEYLYTTPVEQKELNRLFGYSVGEISHYKKNYVKDPNGQVSVSYIDPQGRTIATALIGDAPASLDGLDDENNIVDPLNINKPIHEVTFANILTSNNLGSTGNFGLLKDKLVVARQVVAPSEFNHIFDYSMSSNGNFNSLDCPVESYPFFYDLKISLIDDCGNELLIPAVNEQNITSITKQSTALLKRGTYNLAKTLSVNVDKLNEHADDFVANLTTNGSGCYVDPIDFRPNTNISICDYNCETCRIAIGLKPDYIQKSINQFYNLPEETSWSLVINGSIITAIIPSNTAASNQVVTQGMVDALLVRFNREWELLSEECKVLCDSDIIFTSSCTISESILLNDLRPLGQYGSIEQSIITPNPDGSETVTPNPDFALSIFNANATTNSSAVASGLFYNGTTTNHNWKNPNSDYKYDDGTLAYISIQKNDNNGIITYSPAIDNPSLLIQEIAQNGLLQYKIKPQFLANYLDFISAWDDTWAVSLLSYHPENCYLEYEKEVCKHKNNISYTSENSGVVNLNLSSSEYDELLRKTNSYAKAVTLGLFSFSDQNTSSISTKIFKEDPYFKERFFTETPSMFILRKGIMVEAIESDYLQNDDQSITIKLYESALQTVLCNSISACNLNLNNPSIPLDKQDMVWNTYKALYLGLKAKIQHVFINIYALEKGCYNGCIGDFKSINVTNVLSKNFSQKATLYSYINNPINVPLVNSLCNSSSATLYGKKDKRFIPVDYGYNSGIPIQTAIDQLVAEGDFEHFAQTGDCPLLLDLEIFLTNRFKTVNETTINLIGSGTFLDQYLTEDLLKALGNRSQTTIVTPVQDLSLNTSVTSGNLSFAFSSTPNYNLCPIEISSIPGYNWSQYKSVWKIVSIKDYYFDEAGSNFANRQFAFKAVAKIEIIATGQKIDVIINGTTCAPIGMCGVNNNGIGQVLDPNAGSNADGVGCTKRSQFTDAIVPFLNKLRALNIINNTTPYNLNNIAEYKNSYLAEFFNEDISTNLNTTWVYDNGSYTLRKDNSALLIISGMFVNGISNPFNTALVTTANTVQNLKLYNTTASGDIVETIFPMSNHPLNFSCCDNSCVGDTDCDGILDDKDNCIFVYNPNQEDVNNNGIGDNCEKIYEHETTCSKVSVKEFQDEISLKNIFNWYLNTSIDTSILTAVTSVPIMNNYVNNYYQNNGTPSSIAVNFNAIRVHAQSDYSHMPCQINYFTFEAVIPSETIITFRRYNDDRENNYEGLDKSQIKIHEVNFLNIQEILDFDILDFVHIDDYEVYNKISVRYIDHEGSIVLEEGYISFSTLISEHGTMRSSEFCRFISQTQAGYDLNTESKNYPTINKQLNNTLNKQSENSPCTTCIPPTVEPKVCTQAVIDKLVNYFAANITNYTFDASFLDLEEFSEHNYHYIVDSYIYYLQQLNIHSSYDPGFLTLYEFGNTFLNYGYADINNVINQYVAYFTNLDNNLQDILSWSNWVDNVFKMANPLICPPAPKTYYSPNLPIDNESSCEHMILNISETYKEEAYNNYIQTLKNKFVKEYIQQAMSSVTENFTMKYDDKEYQYTLYYYDQAGNLTQTVAPEGVKRFTPNELAAKNVLINNYREAYDPISPTPVAENLALQPSHTFKTEYKYNSLNQLVWQNTPDGGETRFAYDKLGRIIASQNAKQIVDVLNQGIKKFSYTEYDELGRIVQAGEVTCPVNKYSISAEGRLINNLILPISAVNSFEAGLIKTEVTRTVYDVNPEVELNKFSSDYFITLTGVQLQEKNFNNRNRVTGVFYYDTYNDAQKLAFNNAIFYNYDVHGNVKEQVTYITPLRDINCTNFVINAESGLKNDCEAHIKRVIYDYDLISGNVNTVTFQPNWAEQLNKPDLFIHKYEYDADNRIVNVQTSSDGMIWEKDAKYEYYAHGPLSRVEIGNKNVQGVDYAYTLQGWLKVVNGENLKSPENDMGLDGSTANKFKAKDAFGYSLNYFDGDYAAIDPVIADNGTTTALKPLMISRNVAGATNRNLYNGNIKQMTTAIRKDKNNLLDVQKNNYTYDQLNRITGMTSLAITPTVGGIESNPINSYSSKYSYDRNGNLRTLERTLQNGEALDKLNYSYWQGNSTQPKNNQLALVEDTAGITVYDNDLESQIEKLSELIPGYSFNLNNKATHNYIYDEIGQLIEDKTEGITINWRVDGKVKSVRKELYGGSYHQDIEFIYDGLGNRIAKSTITSDRGGSVTNSTYYARDAQGNVLGVYALNETSNYQGTDKKLYLNEHHIYGSSRLGLEDKTTLVYSSSNTAKLSGKVALEEKLFASNNDDLEANSLRVQNINLNSLPVFRDYSLRFNPGTFSNWPIVSSLLISDPKLLNYQISTKLKTIPNGLVNGQYKIGELFHQGNEVFNSTSNVSLYFDYDIACLKIVGFSNSYTITKLKGGLVDPIELEPLMRRPPTGTSCPNYIETYSNYCLNVNQKGHVEFQLSTLANSKNIQVGFSSNNGFFGFKTVYSTVFLGSLKVHIVSPDGTSTGVPFADNQIYKIERNAAGNFSFYINGVHVHTTTSTSNSLLRISTSFNASAGNINNLKVVNVVNDQIKVTSQVELFLTKASNTYKPEVKITKYETNLNTNITTKKNATFTTNAFVISALDMENTGMQFDFNLALNSSSTSNKMIVNGNTTTYSGVQSLIDVGTSSLPTTIQNNLGNSLLGFETCYYNYQLSALNPVGSTIASSFTFDDVTNHIITNNPPKDVTQTVQMNVTPTVERKLGLCLQDQDQDGIYDIYEVNYTTNVGNNYTEIDTDGDGIPNHLDTDDDGDGIMSKYEGNDPNGDHIPNDALNTDGQDNPNYLDLDDDNDGYLTWETLEGGPGYINAIIPTQVSGLAYTLDNDSDGIPNYIDSTNGLFQVNGEFNTKSFVSLIGDKRYELSNHLGNVLVVINDKKLPEFNINDTPSSGLKSFSADVLTYSDYYPFGMTVPGRTFSSPAYRYGFQGQEKDDELKGEGNSLNYTFRMHDPRVGRFFAVDPLEFKYPWYTPYQFSGNKPIQFVELEGLEEEFKTSIWNGQAEYTSERAKSSPPITEREKMVFNGLKNTTMGVIGTIGSIGYLAKTGGIGSAFGGSTALTLSLGEISIGISQIADAITYEEKPIDFLHDSSSLLGLGAYKSGASNPKLWDATGQFIPMVLAFDPKGFAEMYNGISNPSSLYDFTYNSLSAYDTKDDVFGFATELGSTLFAKQTLPLNNATKSTTEPINGGWQSIKTLSFGYHIHQIRIGETLGGISGLYNIGVSDIIKNNPQVKNPNKIYQGNYLIIPINE